MIFKKLVIIGALSTSILLGSMSIGYAYNLSYKVQPGDTFWIISQKYGVPIDRLMQANNATQSTILYNGQTIAIPTDYGLIHTVQSGETLWIISQKYDVNIDSLFKANNATQNTVLYIGQKIKIPAKETVHIVQPGDTFWIISQKYNVNIKDLMAYNGADANTILNIGLRIKIPAAGSVSSSSETKKTNTSYKSYTVQKGDILWDIAMKFGVPFNELLKVNNFNESTYLTIGQVIKIPVYNVPVKQTPGEKYGEYLDWWSEAQYVLPVGSEFEVIDFYSGKSIKVKRTTGSNHADCETLTLNDTKLMKEIWGGSLSWARRPVLIKYNGRKIAASMSSLPHAGNEGAPGGVYTTWRSEGYGAGYNLDWVKGNGIDGVFDIHFANSTRHSDGKADPLHQANIRIAAGK